MEAYQRRTRMTRNQQRQRKFLEQKLMGIAMLILSGLFLWMVAGAGEDCGAVIIIAPLGLILLFSKKIWIV